MGLDPFFFLSTALKQISLKPKMFNVTPVHPDMWFQYSGQELMPAIDASAEREGSMSGVLLSIEILRVRATKRSNSAQNATKPNEISLIRVSYAK